MIGRELPYYQGQVRSFIYESKGNGQDFCDKLLDQIRVKEDFLMYELDTMQDWHGLWRTICCLQEHDIAGG